MYRKQVYSIEGVNMKFLTYSIILFFILGLNYLFIELFEYIKMSEQIKIFIVAIYGILIIAFIVFKFPSIRGCDNE